MAVREEVVRLSLKDDFTTGMAKAAAAAALFDKSLKGIDGSSTDATRAMAPLGDGMSGVGDQSRRASSDINQFTGRLRLATDAILMLGPATIPVFAGVAAGAVALSAQMTAVAAGAGVMVAALSGIGDGLEALDAYQLDPTTANLEKFQQQMEKIGPSGQSFVAFLDSIEPQLRELQMSARDGFLPGLQEGIANLLRLMPQARTIVSDIAQELGDLASRGGKALAGEDFRAFFQYLQSDAAPTLRATAETVGLLTQGVANLLVAFSPLSAEFAGGLRGLAEAFAEWSAGLSSNTGLNEFLAYVRETGPQLLDTFGALGNMLVQIGQAAAPLAGPVLTAIQGIANAFSLIADSEAGTVLLSAAAAMALFSRSAKIAGGLASTTFGASAVAGAKAYAASLLTVTSAQDRARLSAQQLAAQEAANNRAIVAGAAKGAAAVAGLTLAMTGVSESTGLANTAMLAFLGPVGASAGVILDVKGAYDRLGAAIAGLDSSNLTELTREIAEANTELDRATSNSVLGTTFLGDTLGAISNFTAPLSNVDKTVGLLTGRTEELGASLAAAKERAHLFAIGVLEPFDPIQSLTGALAGSMQAAIDQANALDEAAAAVRNKTAATLAAFDAETAYRQALEGAKAAAKDNDAGIRGSTESALKNRGALSQLAAAWNNQSEAVKNNSARFRDAKSDFVAVATAMGVPIAQAKRLSRTLLEVPKDNNIKLTANADDAIKKAKIAELAARDFARTKAQASLTAKDFASGIISGVTGALNALNGKVATTYVRTVRQEFVNPQARADGGEVLGPRYPYGDKMHVMLAPGEEVISNRYGQADRFRADRAAGRIPGYADGGTIPKRGGPNSVLLPFDVGAGAKSLQRALKELEQQVTRAGKAYDKEQAALDALTSKRDSISGAVSGRFDVDLGSALNPLAAIQSATNQATAFPAIIQQLNAAGLTGPALEQVIQQLSFGQLQSLAADPSKAGQYQTALSGLYAAQGAAGSTAGEVLYGQAIADQTRVTAEALAVQREELMELKQIKNAVKAQQAGGGGGGRGGDRGRDRQKDRDDSAARSRRRARIS